MKTMPYLLFLFTLLLLSSCAPVPAAPVETPTPTSPPTPTFDSARYQSADLDVTYCTMNDLPQKMDIYYPASGGPWPVVVYVHGGSWIEGDKAEGAGWRYLNDQGYLVVSVNYRLTAYNSKFPVMIEDVKCAVRYLRLHAAEYNLDPDHIGAIGFSSGGHLVALLGTADPSAGWESGEYLDQSSRVQAVITSSGFSDFTREMFNEFNIYIQYTFGDLGGKATENTIKASPVTYVTPDDPPFLIVHGEKDGTVPVEQAYVLHEKLDEAGVPNRLVIVQNGGHGFTEPGIVPSQEEISATILEFLNENLK